LLQICHLKVVLVEYFVPRPLKGCQKVGKEAKRQGWEEAKSILSESGFTELLDGEDWLVVRPDRFLKPVRSERERVFFESGFTELLDGQDWLVVRLGRF
jgi:hypothetical protein